MDVDEFTCDLPYVNVASSSAVTNDVFIVTVKLQFILEQRFGTSWLCVQTIFQLVHTDYIEDLATDHLADKSNLDDSLVQPKAVFVHDVIMDDGFAKNISLVSLSDGTMSLVVDDLMLYHPIQSAADCIALQVDIDNQCAWTHDNLMEFNAAKVNI